MTQPKRFRKIVVLEHRKLDFSRLADYGEEIVFATESGDSPHKIKEGLIRAFEDYNPDTDALVPFGRTHVTMMAMVELAHRSLPGTYIYYGTWQPESDTPGDYIWHHLYL